MQADLSRRQLARNLASNLAGFALGIVSNLVLTPYWISHLGVAAFGLVPLTNNLVTYLGVVTLVLSSSVGRFITVEVARGNFERANRAFNTSFWGSLAVALIAGAIGGVASLHAASLIAVPEGYLCDARVMFSVATVTFVVSVVQTPFGAATYCVNRLDLNNWVGVLMRILQIVVGVGLVATVYTRPAALMIASLVGTLAGAGAALVYWRRFMPWSRIGASVDREILAEQLAFGGWSVVNLVGSLLYLQMDLLVINRMLGPVEAGQYAALAQWSFLIRALGGTLSTILGPSITHHYARGDVETLIGFVRRSVLALGVLLALPIGLVAGLGGSLLQAWLGNAYSHLGALLLLMVLPLAVNVAVTPLFLVQSAANRVRVPALVTCIMGAGNLALAIFLTRRMGMYGVPVAGAVMLTLKNAVFTPIYSALCLGCRRDVFFREIARTATLSIAVAAVMLVIRLGISMDSWTRIALVGAALTGFYALVAWRLVLGPVERAEIKEFVVGRLATRLGARHR